jgi:coenzyme PQQ synthesis protein D (PqqD)
LTSYVYRRATDLMEADLGNELVALDPKAGNCFGFNEVATWVWRRLAEPASFDQLRDELLAEYDVSAEQCSRELKALLDDLMTKRLIARGGTTVVK